MQWRKFARLKTATGHSRTRRMLCCGRRKENGRSVPDLTASPGRAPPGPMPHMQGQAMFQQSQSHMQNQQQQNQQQNQQHQQHHQGQQQQQQRHGSTKEPVLLQSDFRKVSGISSEIFRQIEAVENDHDPSTAAALDAVERRGEMIVRIIEARNIGSRHFIEAAQKLLAKTNAGYVVQLVEIVKRPGQTLGLYIREGNGADRSDGVFISRIALESAVYNSGCLRVNDEILAVNLVDVTHMSLDDVVIIMSIPRRLLLAIRQRRGGRNSTSPGPPTLSRNEQKAPPVVVMKRDLRDEMDMDMEMDRVPRSRSSRERRTGDGREMTESRSRLGLGLNTYSPQSEQLDLYYNSRPNVIQEPPSWGYKPPPPPSVITEQPKSHHFAPSHAYYQNAGTLESLAEKVHSFYPGSNRRMSAGTGGGGGGMGSQSHMRFPRSGSDQHLPRVEYADYSSSLGRHSLLRSSLKTGAGMTVTGGGTLGRYGRYDPMTTARSSSKYSAPSAAQSTLTRRSRPPLDYSSDTEATIGPRPGYYYYNRTPMNSMPRGSTSALGGGPDLAKFNSLPRERPGAARLGLRTRLGERLMDDSDGALSAPELPARRAAAERELRNRMPTNSSIFTSDEYRAWLRRAPSSSAICEQMRASRDILNQQRAHRFSCSAENIHDALKNTEHIYTGRTGGLISTLDRHLGVQRGLAAAIPVRSLSTQHIGGVSTSSGIRSPSIRRMRQLLELANGPGSPNVGIGGHQSPAPTPSTTLPRQRQIDINPAEFVKYKLDKPVLDANGISGMIWIHLLAGRGLRTTPEGTQLPQGQVRDLYCVLECDRVHKARTVVRSGDLQFDWDESFELDLVGNKQLDILVYSWDPQHRHKLCYRGVISLVALLKQSPLHQLALKVEPRGTIYLRLRHTEPIALYRRKGLPNIRPGYPQLFGTDLETVVVRESKMFPGQAPVPIVLRRCVEEIERRGLDIIGLYRLCGSATKKRLLRESFERNCRSVELSPEHVPDINVITGVLKDYLRELPEPLFTRCLFQMTVDALAVCLPDDPEGNAKLMLSILDCLPRANRATLVFLLDHLSLVVSASERNKMTAQSLATVMGPPLMLHSSNVPVGTEVDHSQPIAVLKYLLQIWPTPHSSTATSGRRNESIGPIGKKASVSQADKLKTNQHIMDIIVNSPSSGQLHHSVNLSTHPYQSVVDQLAQSPRAMLQVGPQHLPLAALADSVARVLSPHQGTPSPASSSISTLSSSGSVADNLRRIGGGGGGGLSPAINNTSSSGGRFKESTSNYSMKYDLSSDKDNKSDLNKYDRYSTINNGPNRSDSFMSSKNLLFSSDYESALTSSSTLSKLSSSSSSILSSPYSSTRDILKENGLSGIYNNAITTASVTLSSSASAAVTSTLSSATPITKTASLSSSSSSSSSSGSSTRTIKSINISPLTIASKCNNNNNTDNSTHHQDLESSADRHTEQTGRQQLQEETSHLRSSSPSSGNYQYSTSTTNNVSNHHKNNISNEISSASSSLSSASSSIRRTSPTHNNNYNNNDSSNIYHNTSTSLQSSTPMASSSLLSSSVARNLLYSSDSNYKDPYTSPGNFSRSSGIGGSGTSGGGGGGGGSNNNGIYPTNNTSTMNLYGTLPKTNTSSYTSNSSYKYSAPISTTTTTTTSTLSSYSYSTVAVSSASTSLSPLKSRTPYHSSTTSTTPSSSSTSSSSSAINSIYTSSINSSNSSGNNDFEFLTRPTSALSSGGTSSGIGSSGSNYSSNNSNYNTIGSTYRVQYSSTNPFLPTFNPLTGLGLDDALNDKN